MGGQISVEKEIQQKEVQGHILLKWLFYIIILQNAARPVKHSWYTEIMLIVLQTLLTDSAH